MKARDRLDMSVYMIQHDYRRSAFTSIDVLIMLFVAIK